jgi:arylsulfatase A-like enzyme
MNNVGIQCVFAVLYISFFGSTLLATEPPGQPNIIFVLADDLGWAELGCYGNNFNETPHLDALAKRGMRFTQSYASAPVCSPYRSALLTGQHPARVGITDYLRPNSANALSTDHVTLAEMFQRAGYTTGMIGKWHLTGYEYQEAEHEVKPRDHGFDWDFGREVKGVGNGANFWPYVFRTQTIRWLDIPEQRLGDNEYLTDRLNLEAIDFIERNRKRPFFLYLSHYAPHTILNGRPDLVEKYRKKHKPGPSTRTRCYLCEDQGHKSDAGHHWAGDHNPHLAAMLESIDDGIGQIQAKLEELQLLDNTIFVFSSDNGGETNVTSNAPLRGGKSQLYEGGIRVPLIVSWPAAVPEGSVCDQPTANVDFYPTLLDAARIKADPRQTLDGHSNLATWKDPQEPIEHSTLYWHYPLDKRHFLGGESSGAIREGDWKLIEFFDSGKTELYHLTDDPSERRDRAVDHPDHARRLQASLASWRKEIEARIPSPPLLTGTRKLYFADHFSSGQVSNRWFFNKDWSAENGVLQRSDEGTGTTRLFLKDVRFRDVMIRFDFQMQKAKDIRLITGGGGNYNTIIHIRPDHFYIQTAKDSSGPYFSYRHGECAYAWDPQRWYTMTVEFIGDQLVAHVDRDHVVYATHPILDRERSYFAIQVDAAPATFDNVQILKAVKHPRQADNLMRIHANSNKYPVQMSIQDRFVIQKNNAHEWLYQRHEAYRSLVTRVDGLDERNKRLYPDVFRSHKEYQKAIGTERKKLHAEDPKYKESLFATFRAARSIDAYLIAQQPSVANLPDSRRKRELERLRKQHSNDPEYRELDAQREIAQKELERRYPQLFRTNVEITAFKRQQRRAVQNDPAFKQAIHERSDAWRAQQNYLFEHDTTLAALRTLLEEGE